MKFLKMRRRFPTVIPNKPKRRQIEASVVEDFVHDSLERTFESIWQQNSDVLKDRVMKDKLDNDNDVDSNCSSDDEDRDRDREGEGEGEGERGENPIGKEMLV
ncbi:unnamed protein product [Fraxinus pennsylvanica]|uniref:Uncharacterized protein n=1 Tax=Fraxinus pennsylvanica TaxID=56036 RepID=A0AAD1ZP46_9LAMI|nr:unnamed protein product [Fraxinus pennsylvanica]